MGPPFGRSHISLTDISGQVALPRETGNTSNSRGVIRRNRIWGRIALSLHRHLLQVPARIRIAAVGCSIKWGEFLLPRASNSHSVEVIIFQIIRKFKVLREGRNRSRGQRNQCEKGRSAVEFGVIPVPPES